jgi:hypothetical protein
MCLLLLSASHAAVFNENQRVYELPLSFLVLTVTYISRELAAMGQDDGISRIAHLLGVASGVAFALRYARSQSVGASDAQHDALCQQQQQLFGRNIRDRPDNSVGETSARRATGKPL